MSAKVNRTPKSGRQSLFLNDLATPVSSRRGKFSTPGQAAAVSALWRENFSSSDLPPPPMFTLEDRADFSPEMGIADYPMSPEARSDPRTPIPGQGSGGRELSLTPLKGRSEPSTSYGVSSGSHLNQQGSSGLSWMSQGRSNEQEERGKGSPVEGVVQPGALITLPPPREVAMPEKKRSSFPVGSLNEEEWVTVYGFSPGDTNMVLREFEKCGVILHHVPGPRSANWMHILFQNRSDAQKALSKDGKQMNGVLIVGVKPVDPMQRQALSEMVNNHGFTSSLPPPSCSQGFEPNTSRTVQFRPNNLQNGIGGGRQPMGAIAAPAKSVVSKVMDLMFGV
ncbi:hypothetical protein V2J09_010910 [Rumex salicifolius]